MGAHTLLRADLGLIYFVRVDSVTGRLLSLNMTPTQVRHFRVNRASRTDAAWIATVLNREGKRYGTAVTVADENRLLLTWKE